MFILIIVVHPDIERIGMNGALGKYASGSDFFGLLYQRSWVVSSGWNGEFEELYYQDRAAQRIGLEWTEEINFSGSASMVLLSNFIQAIDRFKSFGNLHTEYTAYCLWVV